MELTLVEIELTVFESVLTAVPRFATLVFTVPSVVWMELIEVDTDEVAELIELTLVDRVPIAVLMDATDAWSAVTSLLSVVQPATRVATDLPIAVTLEPIPVTEAWLAPAPLTVKEPMFEAANPEVLLVTEAPTR